MHQVLEAAVYMLEGILRVLLWMLERMYRVLLCMLQSVEGELSLREVPEVLRCVLLCLLEVFEVPDVPEVISAQQQSASLGPLRSVERHT